MSRASVISPYQKFYAADGITPLSGGSIVFYDTGTTDLLAIYSDRDLTTPQTNPYDLDAGGAINGDVFFATLATLVTYDAPDGPDGSGAEIQTFDDVSCIDQSIPFGPWDPATVYSDEGGSTNIVQSPVNDALYISIQDNNLNHEPSASPLWWSTWPAAFTGGSLSSALNFARATVASHPTAADIWSALGNQIDFTGTATVTAFPNAPQAGSNRTLICAAACSFTAGANMLIAGVSSGNTVTCAANDKIFVEAVSTTQFNLTRNKYDGTAQNFGPAATQAEVEAVTLNTVGLTPLNASWHPGVVKVWIKANGAGTSILASHNVSGIIDEGTGTLTVTINTDFSSANYEIGCTSSYNVPAQTCQPSNQLAGSFRLLNYEVVGVSLADPDFYHAHAFGDQ